MRLMTTLFCLIFTLNTLAKVTLHTRESKRAYDVEDIKKILDSFNELDSEKNILFYVHGRSKTLEKEWSQISEIEDLYNVRVVMLHWDSWNSTLDRPVKSAEEAASSLAIAFKEIEEYKIDHPNIFETKKFSLLCHSMGNLIFMFYLDKYFDNQLSENLFDTISLTAADVPATDHYKWLSKVNFATETYVVMNNDDDMLLASVALDVKKLKLGSANRLGLGVSPVKIEEKKIARQVKYVDISKAISVGHRYFESDSPVVRAFYKKIFSGDIVQFSKEDGVYKKRRNVYYLKDE